MAGVDAVNSNCAKKTIEISRHCDCVVAFHSNGLELGIRYGVSNNAQRPNLCSTIFWGLAVSVSDFILKMCAQYVFS